MHYKLDHHFDCDATMMSYWSDNSSTTNCYAVMHSAHLLVIKRRRGRLEKNVWCKLLKRNHVMHSELIIFQLLGSACSRNRNENATYQTSVGFFFGSRCRCGLVKWIIGIRNFIEIPVLFGSHCNKQSTKTINFSVFDFIGICLVFNCVQQLNV